METLILHPTPMAQWHALVEEARMNSDLPLSEDLESYLIFLLMRFTKTPEVVQNIVAVDFLQNIHLLKKENQEHLRDVGDKCLLFSGLFPGIASQRHVRISYYVKLGQNAYSLLSACHQNEMSKLFGNLCQHFVGLMDVLRSLRELGTHYHVPNLLEAEQLWQDTQSAHALKVLRRTTQGFLLTDNTENLRHKH